MKTKQFATCVLFSVLLTTAACSQPSNVVKISHPAAKDLEKYSVATFAAGCFWHEEALFESIKGVKEAVSGYAGGTTKHPTYGSVENGSTGHAETVNVYYDSAEISFPQLLKVYFAGQHPTQQNGQGNDRGPQYRSIAFYRNENEKAQIEQYIQSIQPSYKAPIAAQVMPFITFWKAEDYHQNYIEHNPGASYVQFVSIPEIKQFQKANPSMVKAGQFY